MQLIKSLIININDKINGFTIRGWEMYKYKLYKQIISTRLSTHHKILALRQFCQNYDCAQSTTTFKFVCKFI